MLLPIIFLISGCSQNDSTGHNEFKKATHESTSSVETSSTDSSTSSTKQVTSSTKKKVAHLILNRQRQQILQKQQLSQPPNHQLLQLTFLAGYSDLQIEYARVWLATMGTQYKEWLTDPGFKLHVTKQPAGTPIDPYDQGSVTYPTETIIL